MVLEYPLILRFKRGPFAAQIRVTNASGALVFYVKQKLLARIDDVIVYADHKQSQELYRISLEHRDTRAGHFQLTDQKGVRFASLKREGRHRLWKPRHWIYSSHGAEMVICDICPFLHVMDTLWEFIPIVNLFHGGIFHPTYHVTNDRDNTLVIMRVKKKPSFREEKFVVEKIAEIGHEEQITVILSLIMMLLLDQPHWSIVPG